MRDTLCYAHHEAAHDEGEILLGAFVAYLLLNVGERHDLDGHSAAVAGEEPRKLHDLILGLLGGVGEGKEMHRDEPYTAAGDHIGGDRAVDAAGEERHRHAAGAYGHAARAGHRGGVDIGRKVAHLDMHGKLRVVDVHACAGERLGKLAAHILAQLYAAHGEALVAAAGLDLEALRAQHILPEVFLGQRGNGVLVLLAGGGAGHLDDAEHLFQRLERRVHIGPIADRLDINDGLKAVYVEFADGREAALDVSDQLCLKGAAVESLQDHLAELENDNIVHFVSPDHFLPYFRLGL